MWGAKWCSVAPCGLARNVRGIKMGTEKRIEPGNAVAPSSRNAMEVKDIEYKFVHGDGKYKTVSWRAMSIIYGEHGLQREAELATQMSRLDPDCGFSTYSARVTLGAAEKLIESQQLQHDVQDPSLEKIVNLAADKAEVVASLSDIVAGTAIREEVKRLRARLHEQQMRADG